MAEKPSATSVKHMVDAVRQWPRKRQLTLAAATLVSVAFFAAIILQSRQADYQLLFGNLDSADAATVIERLKEQKIPYRLEKGGQAILIPANQVHETRLNLAGSGLPRGGGIGFEVFDKQSFGMTDFAQKINYQRALQGELARTIASLEPVEAARVHLVLPEKRLFREQQQKASASVILQLAPGQNLRDSQITGILNLVAGSVEGLDAEQVAVIDSSGRVLSSPTGEPAAGGLSPDMLTYQQNIERNLELRAQAMLDRALGMGNSMVQVTASVDFSQRERVEETFDPNTTAVRSEHTVSERGSSSSTQGVPGVQANLQGNPATATTTPSNRSEESVSYEISKVVSKQIDPVGRLKNLSVAVLVADKPNPESKADTLAYVPRNAAELAAIEKMVSNALGIDRERGDQIAVVSRPFEAAFSSEPPMTVPTWNRVYQALPFIKYLLMILALALFYFLVFRPLLQILRQDGRLVEHYKTVEQLESEIASLEGQTPPLQLPGAPGMAQTDPAQIIKAWLKQN